MSFANTSIGKEKLDSELLRTFLAIADTGSFTKGADRILRSQSAVSLQIKRLESLFGQPVFERHARGVALTLTGERLWPVARRVVDLLDMTIGELRSDALEGAIRIGIPEEYGETILPEIIARFARDHPLVELAVRCGFSTGFPQALARDELDLAVYAVESAVDGAHILLKEKTVWVRSRHCTIHELDILPVALFDRSCWWRDRALEALESAGQRFRVVYTSESGSGVIAAIAAGAAIGLLGKSSVRDDLTILTQAEGFPTMPDSTLVLDRRCGTDSPAAEAMAAAILEAFSLPDPSPRR